MPAEFWTCSTCEERVVVDDGTTAVYQRGYWWHAPCVTVDRWEDGAPVVAFPSEGKLMPETIMEVPDAV